MDIAEEFAIGGVLIRCDADHRKVIDVINILKKKNCCPHGQLYAAWTTMMANQVPSRCSHLLCGDRRDVLVLEGRTDKYAIEFCANSHKPARVVVAIDDFLYGNVGLDCSHIDIDAIMSF